MTCTTLKSYPSGFSLWVRTPVAPRHWKLIATTDKRTAIDLAALARSKQHPGDELLVLPPQECPLMARTLCHQRLKGM